MKKILIGVLLVGLAFFVIGNASANERAVIVNDFSSGAKTQNVDKTNASWVIDIEHGKIHKNLSWQTSEYLSDFDIAKVKYYTFINDSVNELHLHVELVTADGAARVLYSADETIGAAGVTITPRNMTVGGAFTWTGKCYNNVNTTNASATYYDLLLAGSGTSGTGGGTKAGSGDGQRIELKIEPSQMITYKFLSLTDNAKALIRFTWYTQID